MSKPIVTLNHRPLNNFGSVKVSEEMGDRANHPIDGKPSPHNGIDIVPDTDLRILATHDGIVTESGNQIKSNGKGWGNYITIRSHDKSFSTRYAHLKEPALFNVGKSVVHGQEIGTAGKTGGATGVHLHFEILDASRKPINPRQSLAAAFPEFSHLVEAGGLQGDLYGDQNDNTLVGNSKPNYMHGLAGTDTYKFSYLSGSDVIDDIDADGRIVIGGVPLSGNKGAPKNALPKTDSNDVKIEGIWTLSDLGFDLHKVGSDLVIAKSGADVSKEAVGKVTVKDFPFENSRGAFGITLGKTTDLRIDPNTGHKVSNIGYDYFYKSFDNPYYIVGNAIFPTIDPKGKFFALLLRPLTDENGYSRPNYCFGNFDSFGDEINIEEFSQLPTVSSVQSIQYIDSNNNKFVVMPFDANLGLKSEVGAVVIDNTGKKVASQIVLTATYGDGEISGVNSAGFTAKQDTDTLYFHFRYYYSSQFLIQRLRKGSLEKIGNPELFNPDIHGSFPYPNNAPVQIILPTGNIITVSGQKYFTSQLPKLRDLTPSEIISNRDLSSGKQTTNPNLTKQILSFAPETETNLEVLPNPNSVLALIGLDGLDLETAKAKMSFPVNHHSQIEIHSSTGSDYTIDQLLNGEFDFAASSPLKISKPVTRRYLTAKQEDQILRDPRSDPDLINAIWTRRLGGEEEVQKLMSEAEKAGRIFDLESLGLKVGANKTNSTIGNNSTDDDYAYYYGDYDDDAIDEEEINLTEKDYPFTVIKLNLTETESQTIILSGVNATEVAKMPEAYFLTQLQLSQSPTSNPSQNPSQNPSSLPSGNPSALPSADPSSLPSSFPSSLPSGVPSFNPSGIPSSLPSGKPSSIPSHSPTAGNLIMPSSTPSFAPFKESELPSGFPSQNPSGNPSEKPSLKQYVPSEIPSFKPIGEPTSTPSKESKLPTGQPSYSKDTSDLPTSKPSIEEFTSQPSNQKSNSPLFPSTQPSSKEIQISQNPSIAPSSDSPTISTRAPTIADKNPNPDKPQSPNTILIGGIAGAVALAGLGIAATVKFLNRKGAPDQNKIYVDEGIDLDIEEDQRGGRGGGR